MYIENAIVITESLRSEINKGTTTAFHYRVLYACWNALKMAIAPKEILDIFALQEFIKWLTGEEDFPFEGES